MSREHAESPRGGLLPEKRAFCAAQRATCLVASAVAIRSLLAFIMLLATAKRSLSTTPGLDKARRRSHRLLLSIEGNIGIGKSTLMDRLRQQYADSPRVVG